MAISENRSTRLSAPPLIGGLFHGDLRSRSKADSILEFPLKDPIIKWIRDDGSLEFFDDQGSKSI